LSLAQKQELTMARNNGYKQLSATKEGSRVLLDSMRGRLDEIKDSYVAAAFSHPELIRDGTVKASDIANLQKRNDPAFGASEAVAIRTAVVGTLGTGVTGATPTPSVPLLKYLTNPGQQGEYFGT